MAAPCKQEQSEVCCACYTDLLLLGLQEDDLSEHQIRVGLAEKRLDNATKEADDRVDKIQHKLDEVNFELKRKDK